MGSSYVEYRGRGIWATEGTIELWLLHLIEAARPDLPREAWLQLAIDHWQLHATVGFQGCIGPDLDTHLRGDPHREAVFQSILDHLTENLTDTADTSAPARPSGEGDEPSPDIHGLLQEFTATVGGLVPGDGRPR